MSDVLFAVMPGVVLLDIAGPAEAFRLADTRVPGSYHLRYAAPSSEVKSAVGLHLGQLEKLPEHLDPGSTIVIAGVSGKRVDFTQPAMTHLVDWLRRVVTSQVKLLCVCAGSVIAAKAGLLSHLECTTHHSHLEELKEVDPTARVLDNRIFVEAGAIWSSAGVTAGIDLALHLISRELGARVCADVARELVVYLRRSGADPALSPWVMHRNHLHPAVHRVQDAVARQPAASWSARELSAVAHTSPRNLARLFAEHAHCSPLDYVQLIRVALAKELVVQSSMDLERVASKAGFTSAHQMRRVWSRWESQPPSAFRTG